MKQTCIQFHKHSHTANGSITTKHWTHRQWRFPRRGWQLPVDQTVIRGVGRDGGGFVSVAVHVDLGDKNDQKRNLVLQLNFELSHGHNRNTFKNEASSQRKQCTHLHSALRPSHVSNDVISSDLRTTDDVVLGLMNVVIKMWGVSVTRSCLVHQPLFTVSFCQTWSLRVMLVVLLMNVIGCFICGVI